MIDRGNVLSLTRQAKLLRLSRSSVYLLPRPVPPARLIIMHRIDALHLDHPFAGSRMLRDMLRLEGVTIGRQAIAISMDGRGAWRDNVFVERLWRTVKYEEVYLRAYDSVSDARASLGRYLAFYNARRPHSSLGARTPEQAYLDHLPQRMAA